MVHNKLNNETIPGHVCGCTKSKQPDASGPDLSDPLERPLDLRRNDGLVLHGQHLPQLQRRAAHAAQRQRKPLRFVGPARYCSPRHRMSFNSRLDGPACWRHGRQVPGRYCSPRYGMPFISRKKGLNACR
jgi:hypothetical protein